MRLNRFLARAGYGSRRAVEDLIRDGRVFCNGERVDDLGRRVDPDQDRVEVDGQLAQVPRDFRVYAFHKPLDVVSTLKSQGGQPTLLPYRAQGDMADRFVPVGRLDSDSTGLLLWTDDGELNQRLCRPGSRVWKTYELELNGPLGAKQLELLSNGTIRLDGRCCLPARLEMQPDETNRHWIMHLHEGRKRQIRRMVQAVGLKVLSLHRTAIGPIRLGLLHPGDFRRLSAPEVAELRRAVEKDKK